MNGQRWPDSLPSIFRGVFRKSGLISGCQIAASTGRLLAGGMRTKVFDVSYYIGRLSQLSKSNKAHPRTRSSKRDKTVEGKDDRWCYKAASLVVSARADASTDKNATTLVTPSSFNTTRWTSMWMTAVIASRR